MVSITAILHSNLAKLTENVDVYSEGMLVLDGNRTGDDLQLGRRNMYCKNEVNMCQGSKWMKDAKK